MYLNKKALLDRLNKDNINERLVIRPMLAMSQIGDLTVDFRLGTDFLVSNQGREAYIDVSGNPEKKPVHYFFNKSRRRLGEKFLLHPNQTIICTSLEYIKMPEDVFASLNMRSSYSRLGLTISSLLQPAYSGCISLELTNSNNNPIQLVIGARVFQARFYKLDDSYQYTYHKRKYACQVRPVNSRFETDDDLSLLRFIHKNH
jgi:dCTP deaminase